MPLKDEIIIHAGTHSYPVIFGGHKGYLRSIIRSASRVVVVSNPTVYALYGEAFRRAILPRHPQIIPLIMGDGEQYKTPKTIELLYEQFFEIGLGRRDIVIALGGGVVGDSAGFAAATFMRGVRLIQAPTTVLAMVDSSVGGKVGVNHARGKNLIGTFYQPEAVIINYDWLNTLQFRDLISGMGEIIKTAFISSAEFLRLAVAITPARLSALDPALPGFIKAAIHVKAEIVRLDVQDRGLRTILNFGHTFAHAIEKAEGYGRFRHGEAVLAGMISALFLSNSAGFLSDRNLDLYLAYLRPFIDTLCPLDRPTKDYITPMFVDKKSEGGRPVFILLKEAGKPLIQAIDSDKVIIKAIEQMKSFVNHRNR